MPIDLNRFIATFFDEAHEHLESIEEKAMALGSGSSDPETLNSIFRAAHSIKGGSGTSGFTQLSEATHEMETLFMVVTMGDLIGVPVLPPVYSLRLLPYVVPEIATWKRNMARRKDFWEKEEYDLHAV